MTENAAQTEIKNHLGVLQCVRCKQPGAGFYTEGEGYHHQEGQCPPHDMVNYPPHYTSHPSGIECIQVVEHMPFNVGSAVKYCWRAGLKGSKIEDLQKAVWYLNREIERLKGIKA